MGIVTMELSPAYTGAVAVATTVKVMAGFPNSEVTTVQTVIAPSI